MSSAPLIALIVLAMALPVPAKPTQSEVFKSIQDNVNESDSSNMNVVPWICGGVGLILVLAWFGRRQTLQTTPKPLNNPNRLAKEIIKLTALKPNELKQVKLLVEETHARDSKFMCNPLVLLLCPSVLTKTADARRTRAGRRTLLQLIKKLESR